MKKATAKKRYYIPNFRDIEDMPGCCGVQVVSGFGVGTVMSEDEAEDFFPDTYEDEFDEEWDSQGVRLVKVPNPRFDWDRSLTNDLTAKNASRWWTGLCEEMRVACLMATLTADQHKVAEQLKGAGWKAVEPSFQSASTGRIITVWKYIRNDWVMQ